MEFATCAKCGAFNPAAAASCATCQAPLEPEATPAPALPLQLEEEPLPPPAPAPVVAAFAAAPEVLARVAKLEAEISTRPQARALWLQLAQIYVDGQRRDLAAGVIERALELEPGNALLRHKLAQLTGRPEPRPVVVPTAAPVRLPPSPAGPLARLERWHKLALGGLAAVLLLSLAGWLLLSPSTRLLVGGELSAHSPAWSPTGERLAFLADDGKGTRLGVYDLAKGSHRLFGAAGGFDAGALSWSPDGRRLAFSGSGDGDWGTIHVLDVESGQSRKLGKGSAPVFRADGSLLAVCEPELPAALDPEAEDGGGVDPGAFDWHSRFCRVDPDSGASRPLGLVAEYGMALSSLHDKALLERWSAPEGSAGSPPRDGLQDLADAVVAGKAGNVAQGNRDLQRELESRQYMERRQARGAAKLPAGVQVFVVGLEGGEPQPLAAAGEAAFARWTADGERILYAANGPGGIDFWTARADGGDRQAVLTGVPVADAASVTLSADRQSVFFVAPVEGDAGMAQAMTGEAPADLHVAEVGGGKPRRLANRHPFKQRFAVSPDGRRIAYEVGQDVKVLSGAGRSELWLMTR